jgi:hypothetical protein
MNSINNALMIYNVGVWQRMLDSVCLMYISVKYISICETLVPILLYNSMLPYLFSYTLRKSWNTWLHYYLAPS